MSSRSISYVLLVSLLAWGGLCFAEPDGGIPDLGFSTAWMEYEGSETVVLMVVPDGSGPTFWDAKTASGAPARANITLRLADGADDPIYLFPREDIWIQTEGNDLPFCGIFNPWPDNPTDREGICYWTLPPTGGGSSTRPIHVYINGLRLYQSGLDLAVNSPDIDGDLVVNITDVALFAGDFFGNYNFRSDLVPDGVVNLSDLTPLAAAISASCF